MGVKGSAPVARLRRCTTDGSGTGEKGAFLHMSETLAAADAESKAIMIKVIPKRAPHCIVPAHNGPLGNQSVAPRQHEHQVACLDRGERAPLELLHDS